MISTSCQRQTSQAAMDDAHSTGCKSQCIRKAEGAGCVTEMSVAHNKPKQALVDDIQQKWLTLASTAIMAPAKVLVNRGVMTIAPRVDAVVIRTDKATSPCAMYVATFEDCKQQRAVSSMRNRQSIVVTANPPTGVVRP